MVTPLETPVSCILLAGGRGTRMHNQDKGLVLYRGAPLIEHVINCIRPQVDDIVISANRNTEFYSMYSNTVIADENPLFNGPLSGIASCLSHCRHDTVLVVACDMPLLPGNLVTCLHDAIRDHDISIIECNYYWQLALMIRKTLLQSIQQFLDEGRHSLMDWIKHQDTVTVQHSDSSAFCNFNTPHDLEALS